MHLRVRTQVTAEGGTMVAQPQSTEIKTLGYRIVIEDHYIKQFSTKHSKGFQKKKRVMILEGPVVGCK